MNSRTHTIAPGVEYHRVLAGEDRRIVRGILAIVLLIGGMLFFNVLFTVAVSLVEPVTGADGRAAYTPLFHAAGLASVALLIPWSMLIQRWLYGVKGASLHSVISRFRFDIFGRALVLIIPAWALVTVILYWSPLPETTWSHTDVVWFLLATLLLTPLQGAGEEYGFRGLILRVAGGWTRRARAGLVVGIVVSSVLFGLVHFSTDLLLNLNYLFFAVGIALITWRTGGIEIAVVLHAGFNTLGFLFDTALHVDVTAAYDRSAGVGTWTTLLPAVVIVLTTVVVWMLTRRTGPARTPSTAGSSVEEGRAGKPITV
ncbi:CPBP family intramembrane glutamic endopeptidase [Brachybacterium sp. FME24]|uniref:CPBP family intramembrane glutamic endopeptidase n=1 Tax=Brachybacterium sp. FME24 TaxID=2742605 RepID=UPI001866BBE8|nr:type II CAAX endopeptidase family protein [Brachybacterium sp. FME24]